MSYKETLQALFKQYCDETGRTGPLDPNEVAGWAISKKLWQPRPRDTANILAKELADAWREEYRSDRLGRRYRAKHAVRGCGPKQATLWADMETAPRSHMERAFGQRRHQIVGDCLQLKTDADVFNDKRPDEEPLTIPLDFTEDVAELQQHLGATDNAA
jgi:hypothetical protein